MAEGSTARAGPWQQAEIEGLSVFWLSRFILGQITLMTVPIKEQSVCGEGVLDW